LRLVNPCITRSFAEGDEEVEGSVGIAEHERVGGALVAAEGPMEASAGYLEPLRAGREIAPPDLCPDLAPKRAGLEQIDEHAVRRHPVERVPGLAFADRVVARQRIGG
jgi:hypothetical protein